MFIIVWIYVLLWICHLHLFSFGSIYILLWMSCSTSRYNGTQIYTRTYTYTRACPNFNRATGSKNTNFQNFNRASSISVRALCSPTTQRSVQQIEPNFVDVEAKHRPLYRYDLLLPSLALAFRRLADLCRCSNLRLVTLLRFGPFLRY